MQIQPATVRAVRLENFASQEWLAPLHPRLMSRYPSGYMLYQNPYVVLAQLNTGRE